MITKAYQQVMVVGWDAISHCKTLKKKGEKKKKKIWFKTVCLSTVSGLKQL